MGTPPSDGRKLVGVRIEPDKIERLDARRCGEETRQDVLVRAIDQFLDQPLPKPVTARKPRPAASDAALFE